MKFYVNPQISVELLSVNDVLTTSLVIPTLEQSTFKAGTNQEATDSFGTYFGS